MRCGSARRDPGADPRPARLARRRRSGGLRSTSWALPAPAASATSARGCPSRSSQRRPASDPAERVTLDESVSMALLVVLERLSPPSARRSCCTTCSGCPSPRSPRSSGAPPRPSASSPRAHGGTSGRAPAVPPTRARAGGSRPAFRRGLPAGRPRPPGRGCSTPTSSCVSTRWGCPGGAPSDRGRRASRALRRARPAARAGVRAHLRRGQSAPAFPTTGPHGSWPSPPSRSRPVASSRSTWSQPAKLLNLRRARGGRRICALYSLVAFGAARARRASRNGSGGRTGSQSRSAEIKTERDHEGTTVGQADV